MSAINRPQLCFGSVSHRRLRPVAHAFNYGVYFMRLPLRSMANTHFDMNRLSRLFSHNRFNLLSFHDKDHGDDMQTPLEWIDGLLEREGIKDADGEIWLQAFPRVLGYVFNPVSFWFCHRSDGQLRAVLCEVRNTFGERHRYLLDTGEAMPYGIELTARKIFHVSPFCEIKGDYRFRFMRTTQTYVDDRDGLAEHTVARINYDDDAGPLLLTSLSGISRPLSNGVVAQAFFRYPLMTFGVVVKIHWQALRLWIKHVPFFRKPQPPSHEMSR
ncbi:DUF1365 domain-containing protein [Herminiimonas fonticola]|uniref:DUF1365 family protein n=1 Tax=Herminiimonas fonticola TaxID=303380 RepID=A0A4R6G4Y0_9BURK|nr:DUF1365 domain-containing protein [Herminiimonas fonticola]RBA23029.1 hypothetical protein Hfont_2832 [Herminiimonas fonticola]TDN89529.1 hypothetical protein EV677_1586 [Herminiimonas fonticola]